MESPEVTVCSITPKLLVYSGPAVFWLPLGFYHRITDYVGVFPVILVIWFACYIPFLFDRVVLSFELVDWTETIGCICHLVFVVLGPDLLSLPEMVEALVTGRLIVALGLGPVVLVGWVARELGEFCSVDAERLVAEFLGHVIDHFECSSLFKHFLVNSFGIVLFKSEPSNTILSLLNPTLAIHIRGKILLKLHLLVYDVSLPLCFHYLLRVNPRTRDPPHRRIRQLLPINLL